MKRSLNEVCERGNNVSFRIILQTIDMGLSISSNGSSSDRNKSKTQPQLTIAQSPHLTSSPVTNLTMDRFSNNLNDDNRPDSVELERRFTKGKTQVILCVMF